MFIFSFVIMDSMWPVTSTFCHLILPAILDGRVIVKKDLNAEWATRLNVTSCRCLLSVQMKSQFSRGSRSCNLTPNLADMISHVPSCQCTCLLLNKRKKWGTKWNSEGADLGIQKWGPEFRHQCPTRKMNSKVYNCNYSEFFVCEEHLTFLFFNNMFYYFKNFLT